LFDTLPLKHRSLARNGRLKALAWQCRYDGARRYTTERNLDKSSAHPQMIQSGQESGNFQSK